MTRRIFIQSTAASMILASQSGKAEAKSEDPKAGSRLRKSMIYTNLPESLSVEDRFKLAADLGFVGIEAVTTHDKNEVEAIRAGADKAGIRIHSVMNMGHWEHPLTSDDLETVKKSVEILKTSLRNAKAFGADVVLLVPAVVTSTVRYKDAWPRSQKQIEEILPLARELGVSLGIENVGNRFLLSPLEFARYIDEIDDPHVCAYFDIGNALPLWSYPQDWILTLGSRIRRFHLKDYDTKKKGFVIPGDGDVDWPVVMQAIRKISYEGYLTFEPNYSTPELKRGDRDYLEDVSRRIDRILEN